MKKLLLLCFCLLLFSSFTFAREIRKPTLLKEKLSQQQISGSTSRPSEPKSFSQKIQNMLSFPKKTSLTSTGSCITGNQLIIRDKLSKKAQEASKKISLLLPLSEKINYPVEKFSTLAKNIEALSLEIADDCLPKDFQYHRQQIKNNLDLLKIEISGLRKHIVLLRTP